MQYDAYEPLPGARVNGRQTLPEDVADLTGLAVACDAWQQYVRDRQGGAAPVLGGLSGDRRFFLANARAWRMRHTEASLRAKLQGDSHAPGMYQENGIVLNLAPWYTAFGVAPAQRLYPPPDKRVAI